MAEYKAQPTAAQANVAAAGTPLPNPSVEALANSLKEAEVVAGAIPKAKTEKQPVVANEIAKSAVLTSEDFENLSDEDFLKNMSMIEAKPLGFGEFLNVKPIDKKYYYRWVNKHGQRQASARAQGFSNATFKDVEVAQEARQPDGTIAFDDVILMRLPKLMYFQAQKYIIEKSARMGNKEDVDRKNLGITNKEIASVRGPQAEISKKVSAYIPPIQQ